LLPTCSNLAETCPRPPGPTPDPPQTILRSKFVLLESSCDSFVTLSLYFGVIWAKCTPEYKRVDQESGLAWRGGYYGPVSRRERRVGVGARVIVGTRNHVRGCTPVLHPWSLSGTFYRFCHIHCDLVESVQNRRVTHNLLDGSHTYTHTPDGVPYQLWFPENGVGVRNAGGSCRAIANQLHCHHVHDSLENGNGLAIPVRPSEANPSPS
jgi:hypothetical protein